MRGKPHTQPGRAIAAAACLALAGCTAFPHYEYRVVDRSPLRSVVVHTNTVADCERLRQAILRAVPPGTPKGHIMSFLEQHFDSQGYSPSNRLGGAGNSPAPTIRLLAKSEHDFFGGYHIQASFVLDRRARLSDVQVERLERPF